MRSAAAAFKSPAQDPVWPTVTLAEGALSKSLQQVPEPKVWPLLLACSTPENALARTGLMVGQDT